MLTNVRPHVLADAVAGFAAASAIMPPPQGGKQSAGDQL